MKLESEIYLLLKDIIPYNSEKNIVFIAVTLSSYEMFFYSLIQGKYMQCNQLAEEGMIDGEELDNVFSRVAQQVRKAKEFDESMLNIATVVLLDNGASMALEQRRKDESMYRLKKEWKAENNIGI